MERVVENIRKCVADKESVLANLELICTMSEQAALCDFVRSGGIKVTVEALGKHIGDPEVLACGFALLSKLAQQQKVWAKTDKKAVITVALAGIDGCQNNREAQLRALDLLCSATKPCGGVGDDDDSEKLWNEIGRHTDAIAATLARCIEDPNVQTTGLHLLSLLYLNAPGSAADPRGEGIRAAVRAMKAFPDSQSIQRYGLGVIGLIELGNAEQQEHVLQCGGVEVAVASMKRWREDPAIQGWGCYALGSAGFGNRSIQGTVQKLGGVACVVEALKRFKDDENVQEWSIKTLAFLAHDNLDVQVELYANGIEAALEAMKEHPTIVGVQQWGNNLISCLSSSDQTLFRDKVVALGGVDVVLGGIRQFRDVESVQKSGISALGLLGSKKCGEIQSRVAVRQKGFDDIVYTMLNYESNGDMLLTCCCAIKELTAGNVETQEAFGVTFNGVEAVMFVIANYEDCVELQREAWCVMANISENVVVLEKFLAYEGIEMLQKSMDTYCNDDSIQRSCLTVLLNIGKQTLNE